ncbi:MAG: terminase small subunit [Planctomycetes bacterium]|nr:terminase small subunit [Planctomycetota bacterium]
MSDLTDKQKLFINAYLECWNATEAARRAGYEGHDGVLANIGWENVRKPQIKNAIKKRLNASAMTADEALSRLAAMARGDIGEYIDGAGVIDWIAVKENGHLFKGVTHVKGKQSSFAMHDSQSALIQLLRAHGAFTQKIEHTGKGGGPIQTAGTLTIIEYDDDGA